jgi:putative membrane protein
MRNFTICAAGLALFGLAMVGCETAANVNTSSNVNRTNTNAYSNTNMSNSNSGSTLGNAANSMANAASSMTTPAPESFLTDVIEGGNTEVALGKLAQTQSKNADIKKFGQMLVTDHSKANQEASALVKKLNFTDPTGMGSHQSTYDKMKSLTGDDFDQEFVEDMVSDHEKDISTFQKESQNSTNADVKAFATKTLPVLQKHLDTVKGIQAKMKP